MPIYTLDLMMSVQTDADPGIEVYLDLLQANVETMIAREIIAGSHVPGDTLTVDAQDGRLILR